jgi:hypothetical protein
MAAMKFSTPRNPNERRLMDLMLLFIPSTAPSKPGSWFRAGFRPDDSAAGAEFLERLQLRPHRRVDPLGQVLASTRWLLVGPKQLEGFFQIPGSHQRAVPADQRGEPLLLMVREIPGILQEQPARSLEGRSLLGSQLAPQVAPNCLHCLIQRLDDVKLIEQDLRVGRVFPDQFRIRRPYTWPFRQLTSPIPITWTGGRFRFRWP